MTKNTFFFLIILLLLLIPIVVPLVQPGFFVSDDGDWMVIRLSAFHETLKTGQFPVRFLERLNHGYGYPVTDFLYPLPFYLGEIIHLLGFNFVDSVKILFGMSFLLGAFSMFFYAKDKWGNQIGIIAAVFYTYFPYRIFDVYKRGSLGESVAFVFIPLVFLFYDRLVTTKNLIYLSFGALATAAMITSHNTVAFLTLLVLIAYITTNLFSKTEKKWLILSSMSYLGLSLTLSAFFVIPALVDLQFTKTRLITISDPTRFFLSLDNLLSLAGIPIMLITGAAIHLIRKGSRGVVFWTAISIVSILMAMSVSDVLWANLSSLSKLVQFPWRFLSITALAGAILTGFLLSHYRIKILFPLLIILPVIFSGILTLKIDRTFHPESYYTTNDDSTTVKNEYMPIWVKKDPTNLPKEKIAWIDSNLVRVNTVYFPGWAAYVNGQEREIIYQDDGLIKFAARPDDKIELRFEETPLRAEANLVTILGIFLALALILLPPKSQIT
ncbi:MAG: hypothetical protein UY21_C0001G0068 [Microgenomates group bacterium GW2011_GWA1_48_10]|nr:MAG: hypothetical protein UY21_C0001G0068 [Microgenomates group bacterium GW2011_GWA1_48_10]